MTAADPTGRYVYGYGTVPADGSTTTILWEDGQPRELSLPLTDVRVTDVNSAGTAVGTGVDSDGARVGFALSGGVLRLLPVLPDGGSARPSAINENGDITGSVAVGPFHQSVPVVWPADAPDTVRELAHTDDAVGLGIDDDGTVVGRTGIDLSGAQVWHPDGTTERLPAPSTGIGWEASDARNGWAIGDGLGDNREATAVRWNVGAGTAEILPREVTTVVAVNADGVVAGEIYTDTRRAVLVRGQQVVPLPQLATGKLTEPVAVTDDGVVFGTAWDAAGAWRAVVWRGC